jgi:hypothetical protein
VLSGPFSGASAIISTSSRLTGMSRSMHASLYNRSSHPILKSAPRCTVSLTMLSLLPVLSQGSCLSPHWTLHPISVTSPSRLSSQANLTRLQQTCHISFRACTGRTTCGVRTREALPAVGSSSSSATTLTSGPSKVNGFDAAAETGRHLRDSILHAARAW